MKAFIVQPSEKIFNSLEDRKERVVGRIIEKVDWEDPEGILTYIKGFDYPIRGYPYPEVVRVIAIVKRSVIAALRLPKPLLVMAYFFKWRVLEYFTDYGMIELRKFVLKPDRFCRSGREIGRIFTLLQNNQANPRKKEIIRKLGIIVQMTWEYDNGYRYPGQLILGGISEKSVRGLRESITRYLEKEANEERKKKISSIIYLLWLFKEPIESLLSRAKIDELKADEMDIYFINKKRTGQ